MTLSLTMAKEHSKRQSRVRIDIGGRQSEENEEVHLEIFSFFRHGLYLLVAGCNLNMLKHKNIPRATALISYAIS